jgi:hypothetical protein
VHLLAPFTKGGVAAAEPQAGETAAPAARKTLSRRAAKPSA